MPDLDLDAIRARVEAASPGPWAYLRGDIRSQANTDRIMMSDVDMEFITHAREDIPALLDEITELRAQLDDAHRVIIETRTAASDTFAALRDSMITALGWTDDGRTSLSEYLSIITKRLR